jgi:N utilization substance protein B
MKLTRRNAREWAVQMLSAADLNPTGDTEGMIADFWNGFVDSRPSAALRGFAEERVRGVLSSVEEIDAELSALLDNWDLYRLGTVERAVLRMGVWELKSSDVPPAVVINEAVDLSNWFSTPKSRTLVNGVLDKYAKSR